MILFELGISSKLMQGYSLEEIFRCAAENGFGGVELWMNQAEESGMGAAKVKELADNFGIALQVHMDTRDVNLASTNRAIREACLRQVLSAVDFAADCGARVVTVHPGRITSEKEMVERETLWGYQFEAFAALARRAQDRGVLVGVENMEKRANEFVLTQADVEKILRSVDSDSLGTTLDVAHLASIGGVPEAIEAWRLPIVNVHISQSGAKMHLPVFDDVSGTIDFQKVFPPLSRKYAGMLVVEGYVRGGEKENIRRTGEWLNRVLLSEACGKVR